MPILLGALASLFIGMSDSFGRAGSRRMDSVTHVSAQMLVGVGVSAVAIVLLDSDFIATDVLSGGISGVAIATGLMVVYRGMATSSAAVVSPVAGVMGALLPLVWDLATGGSLTALSAVGCAVAILSLGLTTFNPNLGDRARIGLTLGIVGGLLFGIAVITVADTSEASGAWPPATQRALGFAAMVFIATRRNVPSLPPAGLRRFGIGGGLAGGIGMVLWVVGAQQGDLGTVSVVSSTYPAFVAIFSKLFDDDEIRWWQAIGIGGAILGTALIAVGSS